MITDFLYTSLQKRKNLGILRELPESQNLIDLTSNDYLGFAKSLHFSEKTWSIFHQIGSTGSRLLTGNHLFFEELEDKIAHWHGAESCLLYNTGYTANLGLIAALGMHKATFLYDIEIHASMIDGMILAQGKHVAFRHNDLNSLEQKLRTAQPPIFVLVESIYSISGDFAPLKEIADLCSRYEAALIVDEAHSTGICGPSGMGCVADHKIESQVFARIHTFSKALGCHGACILGSQTLKKYLLNFSRPWIYTTALPLPILSWIEASYERLRKEADSHQRRLHTLIHYFQKKTGIQTTQTPIQPIFKKGIENVRYLSQQLKLHGLDVRAIVPPTTKRGKECLRIVLHSFNREQEIDTLWEVLK